MRAIGHRKSESSKSEPSKSKHRAVARYNFYGLTVEVRARADDASMVLIRELDSIYIRFIDKRGCRRETEADLIIELAGQERCSFARLRSGLKSFSFDGWALAELVFVGADGSRLYRIDGGSDPFGFQTNAYYAVLAFVLSNLDNFLQIHAGAVARGNSGIVFPGESGSGKTTLVLSLVRAGYKFLSDEVCLINPSNLSMLPFPRSLFLSRDVVGLFNGLEIGDESSPHTEYERGESLGGPDRKCVVEIGKHMVSPWGLPINIDFVIFPKYQRGAGAELKTISGLEALVRLISSGNVLNMTHPGIAKGQVLDNISSLITGVPCFELITSRIDEAVKMIGDLYGRYLL